MKITFKFPQLNLKNFKAENTPAMMEVEKLTFECWHLHYGIVNKRLVQTAALSGDLHFTALHLNMSKYLPPPDVTTAASPDS